MATTASDGTTYTESTWACGDAPECHDETRPCGCNVITNTSAIASIDGDALNTIHASEMADALGAYTRSTALIVDTTTLHALQALLDPETPAWRVSEVVAQTDVAALRRAITATVDAGLR